MPTCIKCLRETPASEFSKDASAKSGLGSLCKLCAAAKSKAYRDKRKGDPEFVAKYRTQNARWRTANKQLAKECTAKWVAANKERVKAIKTKSAEKNKELRNAKLRAFSANNPGWQTEKQRKWRLNNPDKARAALQKRRAAVVRATPKWFSEFDAFVIEQANLLAVLRERASGVKWHVDHVLPLRGKTVSGLHVWSNIAVIPAVENLRKSNCLMSMQ